MRPEEILGEWKGDEFDNGHPLCGQLKAAGWYGKTFASVKDAKPLAMRGENGELYSNTELGKGEASLWMVEFRGELTATMVYDGRPVFDHLKRIDHNTLMGIMNGKDMPGEIFRFLNGGQLYHFTSSRPEWPSDRHWSWVSKQLSCSHAPPVGPRCVRPVGEPC